jgi:hypothetical protein
MEKKTIESLNSKTWYRLIKVIYVFIFIIIPLLVYSLLSLGGDGLKRVDNSKTLIKCSHSEANESFFADEIGLSFRPNEFRKSLETNTYVLNYRNYLYYDEYEALAIVKKCYSRRNFQIMSEK